MRNRRATDVDQPNSAYHCTTRWRVKASIDEVADILANPLDLPRWWPSVYLAADELSRRRDGELEKVRLHTRGWLPYTLRWDLTVVRSEYPTGFVIAANGDLEGAGVWTLAERDGEVSATFDWRVTARKPLLRRLSPIFKPLFIANHHWAMRQGERSLCRELARRRAEDWSLDARRADRESSPHG